MKTYRHTGGYTAIRLCVCNVRQHRYIHRVVCEAWHGPAPAGCEVLHNDGCKTNNTPENLRWGTRFENLADNAKHGIKPVGESHGMSKLTTGVVLAIRAANGRYADVARQFGISIGMVGRIKRRQNWTHL